MDDLLQFQRFYVDSQIPQRASPGSAGYDLYSHESTTLGPGKRKAVDIGIGMTVPVGTYGRIAPRSGLAFKHGIDVLAGVIDRDYTGLVKVILHNTGEQEFEIKKGDRIAQLVLEKIVTPKTTVVVKLKATSRTGGFGSTGIAKLDP